MSERKKPGPVLRVRVKFVDGKWEISKIVKVEEMTIPASEDLPSSPKNRSLTGLWFEAVDDKDNVIYRQIKTSPPFGVELFEEDGSMSRQTVRDKEFMAEFLIPDKPEIKNLKIHYNEPKLVKELEEKKIRFQPLTVLPLRTRPRRRRRVKKDGN